MTTETTLDLTADIIDMREITDRVEVLEDGDDDPESEDAIELAALTAILDDLRGNGGDHDWRGNWYPGSLIRDSYMEQYARETAEDIYGEEMRAAHWPFSYIDWDAATDAFKQDYSTIEIDGADYCYR